MDFEIVIAVGIIALVVWGVVHYINKRKMKRARYTSTGPVSGHGRVDTPKEKELR